MTPSQLRQLKRGDVVIIRPEYDDLDRITRDFVTVFEHTVGGTRSRLTCRAEIEDEQVVLLDALPGGRPLPLPYSLDEMDRALTRAERQQIEAVGWCAWLVQHQAHLFDDDWPLPIAPLPSRRAGPLPGHAYSRRAMAEASSQRCAICDERAGGEDRHFRTTNAALHARLHAHERELNDTLEEARVGYESASRVIEEIQRLPLNFAEAEHGSLEDALARREEIVRQVVKLLEVGLEADRWFVTLARPTAARPTAWERVLEERV